MSQSLNQAPSSTQLVANAPRQFADAALDIDELADERLTDAGAADTSDEFEGVNPMMSVLSVKSMLDVRLASRPPPPVPPKPPGAGKSTAGGRGAAPSLNRGAGSLLRQTLGLLLGTLRGIESLQIYTLLLLLLAVAAGLALPHAAVVAVRVALGDEHGRADLARFTRWLAAYALLAAATGALQRAALALTSARMQRVLSALLARAAANSKAAAAAGGGGGTYSAKLRDRGFSARWPRVASDTQRLRLLLTSSLPDALAAALGALGAAVIIFAHDASLGGVALLAALAALLLGLAEDALVRANMRAAAAALGAPAAYGRSDAATPHAGLPSPPTAVHVDAFTARHQPRLGEKAARAAAAAASVIADARRELLHTVALGAVQALQRLVLYGAPIAMLYWGCDCAPGGGGGGGAGRAHRAELRCVLRHDTGALSEFAVFEVLQAGAGEGGAGAGAAGGAAGTSVTSSPWAQRALLLAGAALLAGTVAVLCAGWLGSGSSLAWSGV
eukprot:g4956.t1